MPTLSLTHIQFLISGFGNPQKHMSNFRSSILGMACYQTINSHSCIGGPRKHCQTTEVAEHRTTEVPFLVLNFIWWTLNGLASNRLQQIEARCVRAYYLILTIHTVFAKNNIAKPATDPENKFLFIVMTKRDRKWCAKVRIFVVCSLQMCLYLQKNDLNRWRWTVCASGYFYFRLRIHDLNIIKMFFRTKLFLDHHKVMK